MWVCSECQRGPLSPCTCGYLYQSYLLTWELAFEGQVDSPVPHLPVHLLGPQEGLCLYCVFSHLPLV